MEMDVLVHHIGLSNEFRLRFLTSDFRYSISGYIRIPQYIEQIEYLVTNTQHTDYFCSTRTTDKSNKQNQPKSEQTESKSNKSKRHFFQQANHTCQIPPGTQVQVEHGTYNKSKSHRKTNFKTNFKILHGKRKIKEDAHQVKDRPRDAHGTLIKNRRTGGPTKESHHIYTPPRQERRSKAAHWLEAFPVKPKNKHPPLLAGVPCRCPPLGHDGTEDMVRGGESSWTRPFRSWGGSPSRSSKSQQRESGEVAEGIIVDPKAQSSSEAGAAAAAASAAASAAGAGAAAAAAAGAAAGEAVAAGGGGGEAGSSKRPEKLQQLKQNQQQQQQQQQQSLESPVSGTTVEWSAVMSEQKRFGIKVRALQQAGIQEASRQAMLQDRLDASGARLSCLPVCVLGRLETCLFLVLG